jgi:hypothetical protein
MHLSFFCLQELSDVGEGVELRQGIPSTAEMSMDYQAKMQGLTLELTRRPTILTNHIAGGHVDERQTKSGRVG